MRRVAGLTALALPVVCSALVPTLEAIGPHAPPLVEVDGARTLELPGGRIRYQSTGTGDEALLFLHGFNSQLSIWDPLWPAVTACGRGVRIDIPGYGGSSWSEPTYGLADQAARTILFMDTLGLQRVTLVGVSMGGSLAAWIAARYPDRVRGVVLIAPSGYPGALRYRGAFGRVLQPGLANRLATRIASTGWYRRLYPRSRAPHALGVTASYGEPWARALPDIRAHAWLVWSRGDATVPYAYADAVSRAIPQSTLVPVAAAVRHDVPAQRSALVGKLACLVHQGIAPDQIQRELASDLRRNGDL
jgi:pimeloyl-ACP methyl ester carboxylesterase